VHRPFAGSVLAQAVATGTWLTAVAGMAIYSATIAAPFFVLAMSPGLMKKISQGRRVDERVQGGRGWSRSPRRFKFSSPSATRSGAGA